MTSSQLDPTTSQLPRAMTRSGRWIDAADAGGYRQPSVVAPAPDLRQATAVLDAAVRLHDSIDEDTLLELIVREALDILPTDGVVFLAHDRAGPDPVLNLTSTGAAADDAAITMRCLRLRTQHLLEPGHVADLDDHRSSNSDAGSRDAGPSDLAPWRSLLVADLDSAHYSRRRRLLWYAHRAEAFTASSGYAVLFAGHAGLALRAVTERHHLMRAVDARTVTGQATGILMHRYQLSAERAFAILRRYSQERNIKMRIVAETVNRTGELPA